MIRTGAEYRESIRDGREVYIDGERVGDVATHPMFKPMVDIRARIYDMQHEAASRSAMTFRDRSGEDFAIGLKLPRSPQDWQDKRAATDAVFDDIGGVVTRIGDDTAGEMWSLHDDHRELDGIDPRFSQNIRRHIDRVVVEDLFQVSANTDPRGDRSRAPQEQDPDMLLHVVAERDDGIVVRGAKFETAAAYANQAFTRSAAVNWGHDQEYSDYALGFICDLGNPDIRMICRSGFAGRASEKDYPLSNRFDEIDALVVFDNAFIPWEDVLFYRHTRAAMLVRATLHRYSAFAFVQRNLRMADFLIGASLLNLRQTGLEQLQGVQESLARLACYRETIDAHLTAAIATAKKSPGGLLMPNQSLLYAGRVHACSRLHEMIEIARELGGGQVCLTPNAASFENEETGPWLQKFYTINEEWVAEDRRKLLAFSRDLLNSDYAGHRLAFQDFAQFPRFAQLASVYQSFDWDGPAEMVRQAAGISDRVLQQSAVPATKKESATTAAQNS